MQVRGRRRCADCGEKWSYYDTGSVTCPVCGSIHSVSADGDRQFHTDAPVDLDLVDARADVGQRPLREVAADVEEITLEYVSARGFVHAGELQPLDETVVAASHLRYVAAHLRRSIRTPTEDVEAHFLALLSGAPDGEQPDTVPEPLWGPYGLALTDVVDRYRSETVDWLGDCGRPAAPALERLRDHVKRIEALEGEVSPAESRALLCATREVGTYLREDDEAALARATERLDGL
ncbi:MAG: TFIIB-type zinc ribbon-containing protein [Halobacteriales archaeon]